MNITQAKWADAAQTMILASIDGIEMSVPTDMGNLHRQAIAKWEAEGNVIGEYVKPVPPPVTVVKKAYFMAALSRSAKLGQIKQAVSSISEEKQQLWEYANELSIDDKDIIAVAAALNLSLRALFDLAETIRTER